MKPENDLRVIPAIWMAVFILACQVASAQNASHPPSPPVIPGANSGKSDDHSKKPSIDERPVVISSSDVQNDPPTPQRPGTVSTPQDVLGSVKQFQIARENFLKNATVIARENRESTSEDRAALRERMQENLQRLREQQILLRQELKDRAKEMKLELSPDLGRSIANAQIEGRGR